MLPGHGKHVFIHAVNCFNAGGRGIRAGVCRIKTVHVRQDYEQVSVNQGGDQRRKTIVVSEYLADFVCGDHVVLVDDGDNAEIEQ